MLTVGDPVVARYELRDPVAGALADATVTVAVTRPNGTALTPVATVRLSTGQYTATWPSDGPGVWRWTFTATGAVADTFEGAQFVWPAGTVVPWLPGRRQVAKYVAERTLVADQSSDVPLSDFTDLTNPTGPQADEHIAAAVAWIGSRCGTVAVPLYGAATELAAVRAAGMIELSFPVRDADINTAQALLAQADAWLTALCEANEDIDVTDPTGGPGHVLSAWRFPAPVAWGDELIWG